MTPTKDNTLDDQMGLNAAPDGASEEPMSDVARALAEQIAARIVARQDAARSKGNSDLVQKWEAELKHLTAPKPIEALAAVKFDPEVLDQLAIYAAQKVRRLVQAYLGTGRVDPYTEVVLKNARRLSEDGGISNRLVMASLSTKIKVAEKLPTRRAAAIETAATQASSSRKALIALGAGRMTGEGRAKSFVVDFSHPFIRRVVEAA